MFRLLSQRSTRTLLFTATLLFITVSVFAQDGKQLIRVTKIDNSGITYVIYEAGEQRKQDITDLNLSPTLQNTIPYQLAAEWPETKDLKLILLKYGFASLKDEQSSDEKYRAAQQRAVAGRFGIWKTPTPPPTPSPEPTQSQTPQVESTSSATPEPSPTPEPSRLWEDFTSTLLSFWERFWWLINLSVVGVILGGLLVHFYPKLFLEKRLRLLIIGQLSAGKSALVLRIFDSTATRDDILNLSPTQAATRIKNVKPIRWGKYEFFPVMNDIPGSAFASVWDSMMPSMFQRGPHAFVLVLAATKAKLAEQGSFDQRFLDFQLMYTQAFIEGPLGATRSKKPKCVVIFLNKFDLVSSHTPKDSASAEALGQFRSVFKDHTDIAKLAGDRARIPIIVIEGSALEDWNCGNVIDKIGMTVYGS